MVHSHPSKLVLATRNGQGTNVHVDGLSVEVDRTGVAVLRYCGEVSPETIERLFQTAEWMQDVRGARAIVLDLGHATMNMTWLQWVSLADPEGPSAQRRIALPIAFVVKDLKVFDWVRAFGMQSVLASHGARLPTFETQRAIEWCLEELARSKAPVKARPIRHPRKSQPPKLVSIGVLVDGACHD